MQDGIYAHTLKNASPADWQSLESHLAGTADLAETFAASFGAGGFARMAARLHDLGKLDRGFQCKLHKASGLEYTGAPGGSVNHSGAGAAFAEKHFKDLTIGRTLAYLISGHHAGLPDYERDETGQAAWDFRRGGAKGDLEKIQNDIGPYVTDITGPPDFPEIICEKNYHLWVRMLFSCLVDADWLDTERFMSPERFCARPSFPTISELAEKFDASMHEMESRVDRSSRLNVIRHEILEACRQAAEWDPGLFSLTVPTGGGKTLSSMAFALKHAIKYHKQRIIYVIPYTSIIEQTAGTLRRIFGEENVVEHHSSVRREESDSRDESGDSVPTPMDLATENWDAPIIVTTNVQFFESLYSARPQACRKLHRIAESVVLLDEVQMLPPKLIVPCVDVLNHLSEMFGTSLVLCTATQPALDRIELKERKLLNNVREIIPDPASYYSELRRTEIKFPPRTPKSDWETIAASLQEHPRVLCIVNTRRSCRELYERVRQYDAEAIHLSALMCGEHRSKVIEEIRRRLAADDSPIRVISTQLVEAGVDIDFPIVYRAMAGLDSIVQAAGRCNREGRGPVGMVYVFEPPCKSPAGLLRKGEDRTRDMLIAGELDVHHPDTYRDYFDGFYESVNERGEELRRKLQPDRRNCGVYFRHVGKKFRMIEVDSVSVFVKYGEGAKLIERLRREGPQRQLMRQLWRFSVNISRHQKDILLQSGAIEVLETFGENQEVFIQNLGSAYSDEFGLLCDFSGPSSDEEVI